MEKLIQSVLQAVPAQSREAALKNIPYIVNALRDEGILTPNVFAYALATIQHETAGTFNPIEEYYGRSQAQRLGYSGGQNYFGRGYIQLTHDYNYKDMGEKLGVDLLNNPELALDPNVAAKILAKFIKERGVAALAEKGDFVDARRPINPDNKGYSIAQIANNYRQNIPDDLQDVTPTPTGEPKKNTLEEFFNRYSPVRSVQAAEGALKLTSTGAKTKATEAKKIPDAYTVKSGETLWGIAEKTLGSGTRWKELGGYKGDPRKLPIGTKITIPSKPSVPQTPVYASQFQTPSTFTPQISTNQGVRTFASSPPTFQSRVPAPTVFQSRQTPSYSAPSTPSYSAPRPTPVPTPTQRAVSQPVYQTRAPAPVFQSRQPAQYQTPAPRQSTQPKQSKSSSIIQNAINTVRSWFK